MILTSSSDLTISSKVPKFCEDDVSNESNPDHIYLKRGQNSDAISSDMVYSHNDLPSF